MSRSRFTESELAFLREPRGLARVAAVDPAGMPHVVPTGWQYDEDSGDVLLTGRDVGSTRRVRHLTTSPEPRWSSTGLTSRRGGTPGH